MNKQNKACKNHKSMNLVAAFKQWQVISVNSSCKTSSSFRKSVMKTHLSSFHFACYFFVMILGISVFYFGLTGCGSVQIPFLSNLTGSSKSSRTILLTTSANDIGMVCPISPDILDNLKPQKVNYWPTEPGYYRLELETYCLHAGTYGPTEGTGFQLLPACGPLAPQIKAILLACAEHPNIKQETIQSLLWAMLAGIGYDDLLPKFRSAAAQMLPANLLTKYIGMQTLAPKLVDAALPDELKSNLNFLRDFRNRVNNANAKFEDIERMAVLEGEPPGPPVINVPARAWSTTSNGNLWRIQTMGYSLAYADYFIPHPDRIEKDDLGRITYFELLDGDGYSITATYKPDKYYIENPADGKQYPIWRFERIIFRNIDKNTGKIHELIVENEGWIFTLEAILMYDKEVARLYPHDEKDYIHFVRSTKETDDRYLINLAPSEYVDSFDRAKSTYEKAKYFKEQFDNATKPVSKADIDNLINEENFKDMASSIGNKGDEAKQIKEHNTRVERSWMHSINKLAGEEDDDGDDDDGGSDRGAAGSINQPGNKGLQRIGTSNRFSSR
ncbi:MAG: hypothetical protein K8S87_07165 [Planctomycetes bacterium]|nr:hypothetical protein [Planctomycetota bacterium]